MTIITLATDGIKYLMTWQNREGKLFGRGLPLKKYASKQADKINEMLREVENGNRIRKMPNLVDHKATLAEVVKAFKTEAKTETQTTNREIIDGIKARREILKLNGGRRYEGL